jgi:integrase
VRATNPGHGTFYYRYKDTTGKTCHKRIGTTAEVTLAEARKQAKALKTDIALGTFPKGTEKAATATVPTFADFFEQQYMPYVTPRKRSWASDESLYRNYLKDEFGKQRLDQISRQQIQLWHTNLRLEKKLAPATSDHGVKLLKHALNLAVDWSLVEANPAAKVPLFNESNFVEHYLDDDQLERLLTVLRSPKSPRSVCQIALFLLSTGARLNEALSAKWDHVDRHTRVWRIPAATSKSGRVRVIPLNDSALEVLSQLETEGKYEHLFVNHRISVKTGLQVGTGKPYTSIMRVFRRMTIKAGVPFLRIHDLRHQYASFLVNAGRSLYEVQQILGHSDPKVTQRYAHLSTKSLQDAANSASIMIQRGMQVAKVAESTDVAENGVEVESKAA